MIDPQLAPRMSAHELEYITLREETLKRVEARQQQLSITMTIGAAFLGVGWGTGGAVALFIFPPLAALLAAGWIQNEIRLQQIAAYIRDHLEKAVPGLGWESYRLERARGARLAGLPLEILAIGGVFLLTQILAIALGLFRFNPGSPIELALLALDLASVIALIVMVNYVRSIAHEG